MSVDLSFSMWAAGCFLPVICTLGEDVASASRSLSDKRGLPDSSMFVL